MKRILTYTTFCLLLVFASCSEEQLEVYHGDNYVYFTYMNDKSPQKITFNFATDAPLLREGTVKVKMTLLGYLSKKMPPVIFPQWERRAPPVPASIMPL